MAKAPLTPDGVKQKTTDLYLLSDTDLRTQAQQIRNDFVSWVEGNFSLTSDQQAYLRAMDEPMLFFMSGLGSVAIGDRLPVTFVVHPKTDTGSKRFETKATMSKIIDNGVTKAATGGLTIEISYPED